MQNVRFSIWQTLLSALECRSCEQAKRERTFISNETKYKSAKDIHERKRYKASIHIINIAIVVYNDSLNMIILMIPWGCPNNELSKCPKYHAQYRLTISKFTIEGSSSSSIFMSISAPPEKAFFITKGPSQFGAHFPQRSF